MPEFGKYYNRDLSWLSFNRLVLEQMKNKSLPLFERIKFMAIYSSNLDEFYKVRVASYQSLLDLHATHIEHLDYSPDKILEEIKLEVSAREEEYERTFFDDILPELNEAGVILHQNQKLQAEHHTFLKDYFMNEVLPEIQPVLLSTRGDVLSFLQDNVIYLAIQMQKKRPSYAEKEYYAVIKVPTHQLPRFVKAPKLKKKHLFFFLEDIIRHNLDMIFPGYNIEEAYTIKVSRNADLMIEDEFTGNLLDKLRNSLRQRKTGFPARFMYDRNIPDPMLEVLKLAFNIDESDFMPVGRYLNMNDFFSLPNTVGKKYELEPQRQLRDPYLDSQDSIFTAIKKREVFLHFPYQTYDYVLRFFNEAAVDPDVEEIKTTQYRVATNSAIVNALITAARNNKKVTVFVEVKARFDEAANIKFADQMREAGIHVIASLPGLKVHAKAAVVIKRNRRKKSGYDTLAFVSTGNFNEKTAKQYSDKGFFTSDERIINDLKKLFVYLETPLGDHKFKHILVPRFNMTQQIKLKIKREIRHVNEGKKGYIILKMNSIEEQDMIDALYEAGQAGVKIDLIIRGICCLRPDMPFSPNITVTRIVDRYLEHARVYAFLNDDDWDVYISSADFMNRNLHRRVETAVPVYDKAIKTEIIDLLLLQLKDNTSAQRLDKNICNIPKKSLRKKGEPEYCAQVDTYLYLEKKTMMQ